MNAYSESPSLVFRNKAFNPELETLTADLKEMGRKLAPGNLSREAYIEKNGTLSILFMIDIQKWKIMNFGKRGDCLQLDIPEKTAANFYDYFHAATPHEKLRVLYRITPFQEKAVIMAQFLNP
ncbi:hypothetical protein [Oligoflexus tunisiensis]|uniref:hypothetical protein n=1 Tax=Oligoflexus tunisiensis TaxID=708132 RepID=UPI00114D2179|nr:hypothetical protein [Oligoflexus tunisiensis]